MKKTIVFGILVCLLATVVSATSTEIIYDDGSDEGWSAVRYDIGRGVLFTPPSNCWVIDKIKLNAYQATYSGSFYIEIWNKDFEKIGESSYEITDHFQFGPHNSNWAEIDIPDVIVDDDFYVAIFADTGIIIIDGSGYYKLYISHDWTGENHVSNDRSYITYQDEHPIFGKVLFSPNKNTMIRAIGYPLSDLKPGKSNGKCGKGTVKVFEKQIGWAKDLVD